MTTDKLALFSIIHDLEAYLRFTKQTIINGIAQVYAKISTYHMLLFFCVNHQYLHECWIRVFVNAWSVDMEYNRRDDIGYIFFA